MSSDISTSDRSSRWQPIARRSATDAIVRQIQLLIAEDQLKVGDRLDSERDLAAALGVSRPTVREAIRAMASLGILEVRQGSGTFVREPQSRPFADLSELGDPERRRRLQQVTNARRMIDVEVAGLAALAASAAALQAIRDHFNNSVVEPMKTRREYSLDLDFEILIGEAASNPYLSALQREAHRMFEEAWTQGGFIPRPAAIRNEQHAEILEAIENRNPEEARLRMGRHFDLGIGPKDN